MLDLYELIDMAMESAHEAWIEGRRNHWTDCWSYGHAYPEGSD